jgi:hypothetical protein
MKWKICYKRRRESRRIWMEKEGRKGEGAILGKDEGAGGSRMKRSWSEKVGRIRKWRRK